MERAFQPFENRTAETKENAPAAQKLHRNRQRLGAEIAADK
jgi:hypothetical protein